MALCTVDGALYDADAIERWLVASATSPRTRAHATQQSLLAVAPLDGVLPRLGEVGPLVMTSDDVVLMDA